ncbi:hypothetical protein A2715_00655 [Candidatus Woesebacteria bacterium RIFCSPHIGHO2_01_FULL_39_32]|uniref:Uncharacterized protein n=1 Tax=Candidatus Woesebacteria bacterium RIFCSPLOWO2_01_FULL_39_25 TaxID=1802521 RepID=A0A1F8BI73_9BACT|nr:MAG: hypothetical protein A2124_03455 [Candidatus Woesebacteria bacterium GWB1_37_5]OGM24425.1 MAG: hypothetical protein A2715_00655 [Candidatus Woesebacteria bacterium RIFCSPHIGHO2_01_FULL_39_32]OGM35569.1 MAG: hypothetical protein A3F01_02620 [Candidatus Woesebacteria bacterium RIFCSPHIGHO2_12_FULL_38_11]OGM63732.1 MAG: hypothetical protein A2893_01995 [Candidatus Woesebacteria bacterium RIFCSPLOWO2_01_FULL_39_25]
MITIYFLFTILILLFTTAGIVSAHCPLCVAGAGAGLTLSRILGIDDSITGIWLGAFIGALSFWSQKSLGQRNKLFFSRWVGFLIYTVFIGSTIWSFYKFNLVVKHGEIFGIHKLIFGMVLGGALFYLVDLVNAVIKRKNGKSLFPYQSMIFSLGSVIIASLGMYILINYYI